MLIFIDESGCPGFKLGKGSTPFFVVSMIRFLTTQDAEDTAKVIKEIKDKIQLRGEFKFNKTSDKNKQIVFEAISCCSFEIMAIVVDKHNIYSPKLRSDNETFYNFFLKSLLAYDKGFLDEASIKVDGSGDREFKTQLLNYIRRELKPGKIKSLKFVDSQQNVLIQLADMVSGALYKSYRTDCTKTNRNQWRLLLRKQTKNVWDFK